MHIQYLDYLKACFQNQIASHSITVKHRFVIQRKCSVCMIVRVSVCFEPYAAIQYSRITVSPFVRSKGLDFLGYDSL